MATTTLSKIGAACLLAAILYSPASAGDNIHVLPLASDNRGNQAWVEIDSGTARMKATPFLGVGDEHFRDALEGANGKGTIAVPFPRLMHVVERARQAVREMKRPAAGPPAGADHAAAVSVLMAAPPAGDTGMAASPLPTFSLAPPEKTGAAIRPPAPLASAASR